MLLPRPDLHCAALLALWEFLQNHPAEYRRKPEKSYHLSAGTLALCHLVNPALVVALRS